LETVVTEVFVLGAGFSRAISNSMPLLNELGQELERRLDKRILPHGAAARVGHLTVQQAPGPGNGDASPQSDEARISTTLTRRAATKHGHSANGAGAHLVNCVPRDWSRQHVEAWFSPLLVNYIS
jgi:hypothetical protein